MIDVRITIHAGHRMTDISRLPCIAIILERIGGDTWCEVVDTRAQAEAFIINFFRAKMEDMQ